MKRVVNPVDKCNRHYRRMRAKNPDLPPLVSGGGRVTSKGKVQLTFEDGWRLVYRVEPRIEYVAILENSLSPSEAVAVPPTANELVAQLDHLKQMNNTTLNLLAEFEGWVCAFEARVAEAKHFPSNVVMAAE